jgi:hypothetical protein
VRLVIDLNDPNRIVLEVTGDEANSLRKSSNAHLFDEASKLIHLAHDLEVHELIRRPTCTILGFPARIVGTVKL